MSKSEFGDRVKIKYNVKLLDGTIIDASGTSFEFELGEKGILPELTNAVLGMEIGETKMLELPPEKAFGVYDITLIVVLPKDSLPSDLEVKVGQYVIYETEEHALKKVKIEMMDEGNVYFDYNHPLAGKPLQFEITLLDAA